VEWTRPFNLASLKLATNVKDDLRLLDTKTPSTAPAPNTNHQHT
jgi:hypothetical protein